MPLLTAGRVLESPATGQRFEIQGPLGSPGGFGEAYTAKFLRRRGVPETVCVKATLDQTSWHREAYFGELLRGQRRVILFDSFPVVATVQGHKTPLYLLVSELAEHGTVGSYLDELGRGLPPGRAKREVIALLKVLVLLHGGSATHRDLTPSNVLHRRHAQARRLRHRPPFNKGDRQCRQLVVRAHAVRRSTDRRRLHDGAVARHAPHR